MQERTDVETKLMASKDGLMNMLNAAMFKKPEWGRWQKIEVAVDSGAAESVIPHTLVPHHPVKETDRSRAGLCYASATGAPIPNLG